MRGCRASGPEAGISRPSLLYHYGTKHALYSAVVRSVFEDLGRALEAKLGGSEPFADQLDRVIETFLAFVEQRRTAAQLILREILDGRGPGRDMILEGAVPLLEMVERFIRIHGRDHVREGLPIRFALLQIVGGTFVRSAAGSLATALWGEADQTKALARHMFLREQP